MTKLLVFLVLCIASASCVELENVCSPDHFEYDGVLVNAFYRERWNIAFPSLNYYLINSSCDLSEFENNANYWKVLNIKNYFNREFAKFFTNDLENATAEELEENRVILVTGYWLPLFRMEGVEFKASCVKTIEQKISVACQVLETLIRFSKSNGYPISDKAGYKPSNLEAIQVLKELFKKLNAAGDGQTFALKRKEAFVTYFERGLVLPVEFKFLTEGPIQPDTESIVVYEHFLPFNNARHTDKGCVPVEKLPLFYQDKGF